ncbi:MAG TPA: LysE family transporter [Candidatus Angelobacter sp.]|nr:LysE family transporter [Candidatus Angelobacter sp.]
MTTTFLVKGVIVGFSIAAPVGPIGVLCIRRTLTEGRLAGLASGLGAATADAFYGAVAVFGLTAISSLFVGHQILLRLAGGLFPCCLGVNTFLSRPGARAATPGKVSLAGAYSSTLVLTLTNPVTILLFAGVFAGLGVGNRMENHLGASLVVSGVFFGSAAWWLLLCGGVAVFRNQFDTQGLRRVNRVSGVVITVFGLMAIFSLKQ